MLFIAIKLILGVVIITLGLGFVRTYQMEHIAAQQTFLAGKVPNPLPEGLYNGTVPGHEVPWLGKKFNSSNATGINVFKEGNGTKEVYPFVTSTGPGVKDKNLETLKIDYAISPNPFWLRPILDEVVEVAPGEYLGKMHVRIIPGLPFTLAYFKLKKAQ